MNIRSLLPACSLSLLFLAPSAMAQWVETDCVTPLEIEGQNVNDTFGFVVDSVGDVTGDGIADIVASAPLSSIGQGSGGLVRVYDGVTGAALWSRTGGQASAVLGFAMRVTDWNRDGILDVLVSAPFAGGSGGHVWVYSGDTGAILHQFNPSDVGGDAFGYSIAVNGDFDGDGLDDVAIGSTGYDPPGLSNAGRVYVYSGADNSLITAIDGPSIPSGDAAFGTGLTFLGDVDGDGRDDLAAAHRKPSFWRGSARVFGWDGTQALRLYAVPDIGMPYQIFGTYLEGGLDLSGDGIGDFVVGDLTQNIADVYSGIDGSLLYSLNGNGELGDFGSGEIIPDMDGDGLADLILGAKNNDSGAMDAGKVFFYSGASGTLIRTATHTVPDHSIGLSCRCIGDYDGDGVLDYVVGGTGGGTGGPPNGRVFVLKGNGEFDRFCTATANSTGAPALINATGSASVAANNLVLQASPVPINTPGLFFFADGTAQIPFGNGFRCVDGPPLYRLPVEFANGSILTHPLDNTAGSAAGLVLPGSTWHFQAWFRDPAAGGATFNTSDGLTVTFKL